MPVVINEMESTVEHEGSSSEPTHGEPALAAPRELDDDDFIGRYGHVIRRFIRDEIERHLRNLAD